MATFTKEQWAAYLGQLDENPVGEDVRKAVAEFLHDANFAGPKALDGVTQDDIFEMTDAPGRAQVHERALIRRLLRVATVSTSPRPPAGSGADAGSAVQVPDSQGGSALAVAQQLQSTPAVDVTKLLETAHMDKMPYMGRSRSPVVRCDPGSVATSSG